jgi:threonyl-tRNA synthetase
MPTQIKENVLEVLDFVRDIMNSFGFEYNLMVSTRPKKAIGSEEIWNEAIDGLKSALDESGIDYGIDEGGGAFYGPKIDIKIHDSLKREWQCGTIQVDFNLPERFLLEYNNEHNTTSRPVMIHRAILGSFERFIGILTEHCAGEFPFFLAPTQVVIIPILDSHMEYVNRLKNRLVDMDIDVYVSNSSDSLNKKIRVAEKQKVPMIVVIGDQEVEYGRVALRDRRERKQLDLTQEEFYKLLKERLNEVHF